MAIKLKSSAIGYLNTPIKAFDTVITLQRGNGAKFPSLHTDDYFYATLISPTGDTEIVKVIARNGDILTIERGLEGTVPLDFPSSSRIELRLTISSLVDTISGVATIYLPNSVPHATNANNATNLVGTSTSNIQDSVLGTGAADETTYLRGDRTWAPLPVMTAIAGGLVPTPPNDPSKVLLGDGTWGDVAEAKAAISLTGTLPANIPDSALGTGVADAIKYLRGDRTWAPLPVVSVASSGVVPSLSGVASDVLRGDGTWGPVPLSGVNGRFRGIIRYTTPGLHIYTKPASVTSLLFRLIGGGGGGGGGAAATSNIPARGGGGGGAGGFAQVFETNPRSSYTIIVGAGGVGGAFGIDNAGNGGSTSVSELSISIPGGGKGRVGSIGVGGNGGGPSTEMVVQGAPGGHGLADVASLGGFGGNGGGSFYSGGGQGGILDCADGQPGFLGSGGGGGLGAPDGGNGGSGGAGLVEIWEFE